MIKIISPTNRTKYRGLLEHMGRRLNSALKVHGMLLGKNKKIRNYY